MNEEKKLAMRNGESPEEFMWRVGQMKQNGMIKMTWDEYANLMNQTFGGYSSKTESAWRKGYGKLKTAMSVGSTDIVSEPNLDEYIKSSYEELEIRRQRLRDERAAYLRTMKANSRLSDFFDRMSEEIRKAKPVVHERQDIAITDRMVYAMLSDVHYGICFDTPYNSYSPEIAKDRIMKYAEKIISTAKMNHATTHCHVSLMGDMISGGIHVSVRAQNRESVISQTMHISEIVCAFLLRLSEVFDEVTVDSVGGNHSRTDTVVENTLRDERLDDIIPWYCKNCLSDIDNVTFLDNTIESTIAVNEFFGKTYVAVHGDFDPNLKQASLRMVDIVGKPVDVFLSGHMHVFDARMENTFFVQNGCVCGSGDDYTSKKRLNAPPSQTFMICSPDGVDAIYPVRL